MQRMIIEVCETNEARQLIDQIHAVFPDVELVIHPCLDRCNACFLIPFAIVDGELIEAYSPEQLLQKIKQNL
ncbi:DUF1450 domain-containing protein [Effusibacillus consociatus]|uniref:DUF1450 domain-containing protein n=1 Tax=Effusibacillus consociatus TaxID=1117041 RepID=A0ABV9Q4E1_9BACL